jgi:hypothetical protein
VCGIVELERQRVHRCRVEGLDDRAAGAARTGEIPVELGLDALQRPVELHLRAHGLRVELARVLARRGEGEGSLGRERARDREAAELSPGTGIGDGPLRLVAVAFQCEVVDHDVVRA